MFRSGLLCYVMLCYVMLCYVMLCYVMLCYVTLCYAMLWYVTLRYVALSCGVCIFVSHVVLMPRFLVCCSVAARRYHQKAVRSVHFHPQYPLFATASDDGKVHVFHSMVYNDLLTNPLIVPVKILHAHQPIPGSALGVLDCAFHPTQPFLFSAGADKAIRLFTS